MAYTPPLGNDVDFSFQGGYISPTGNNVDFLSGIVAAITIGNVSRDIIYDDQILTGFDTSVVRWQSSASGAYRMEVGGDNVGTGYLVKSGNTTRHLSIKTNLTDTDIEGVTTFSGEGVYRFNIYVKSVDDVWSPYNQV